jgi:predicted ATPase/DNA-binding winged helix-turn-helix (wHTH) protein
MASPAETVAFGRFRLEPARRRLLHDGTPVELGSRAFDLLVALVEQAGALVTKDELLDRVWRDVVVEEANLHVQVNALRRAIGREAIVTVPGRGYQFVLPLQADAGTAASVPAPVLPLGPPGELPMLRGREREAALLQTWAEAAGLVTITGAGGSGKTLLARHLVRERGPRRPQGAAWVELLDLDDGTSVPAAVAAALGLRVGAGTVQQLAHAVRGLDLLLVLDNAEHLLEAVAALVPALCEAAPELRVIVTSQAPLKIPHERVLALRGLDVPEPGATPQQAAASPAVAVFVERARAADRRFRLDATTVDDVVAVCAALGGLPLGLQLAAGLLGQQPLADLRQRLARERRDAETSSLDPATNVLRAALAWSHGLLADAPRRAFRRLAVALGPLPLPVALAVGAGDDLDATAAADALGDLVDRSLVELAPAGAEEPAHLLAEVPRYRLADAPRAVALEALAASGEAAAARAALSTAYGRLAQTALAAIWQGDERPQSPPASLQADLGPALRRAAEHAPEDAAAIGYALLDHQRPLAERATLAGQLDALGDDPRLAPRWRGIALLAAVPQVGSGQRDRRLQLLSRAADAFAQASDRLGECVAAARAAESLALGGDAVAARPWLDRARALACAAWPDTARQPLAYAEAAVASAGDDPAQALPWWRWLCELGARSGREGVAALTSLADVEMTLGDLASAEAHLLRADAACVRLRRVADRIGYVLSNLCALRLARGDLAGARAAAAEGWPQAARFGAEAWWADHLALLAAREGRFSTAAGLLGFADAAYARLGNDRQRLEACHANEAATIARQALGEDRFAALRAEGGLGDRAMPLVGSALEVVAAPGG